MTNQEEKQGADVEARLLKASQVAGKILSDVRAGKHDWGAIRDAGALLDGKWDQDLPTAILEAARDFHAQAAELAEAKARDARLRDIANGWFKDLTAARARLGVMEEAVRRSERGWHSLAALNVQDGVKGDAKRHVSRILNEIISSARAALYPDQCTECDGTGEDKFGGECPCAMCGGSGKADQPSRPAHSYHSRTLNGACTDCGKSKAEHQGTRTEGDS